MAAESSGSGGDRTAGSPGGGTPEEWLAAVRRALGDPAVARTVEAHGLDTAFVISVAAAEAAAVDRHGRSALTLPELAAAVGAPTRAVAKARLVLVDAGLQSLEQHLSKPGETNRTHQSGGW